MIWIGAHQTQYLVIYILTMMKHAHPIDKSWQQQAGLQARTDARRTQQQGQQPTEQPGYG